MNTPQLPTDNLYKFLALSGISLIIASAYFLYAGLESIEGKKITLLLEINLQRIEQTALKDETVRLQQIKSAGAIDPKGIFTEVNNITDKLKEQEKNIATIESKIKELEKSKDKFTYFSRGLCVMLLVGFGAAIVGFWLWYARLQRHLDIIVKWEAAEKSGETNSL